VGTCALTHRNGCADVGVDHPVDPGEVVEHSQSACQRERRSRERNRVPSIPGNNNR
jgi:hypothetical protein